MTVSDLLRALKRHWLLEIILFVVVVGGMAGYTFTATPMYTASTQVMAKAPDGTMAQSSQTQTANGGSTSSLSSYTQLVQSDAVLEPVINNLGLHTTVSSLRSNVAAAAVEGTSFINMTVKYTDANDTVSIINELVKQLNKQIADDAGQNIQLSVVQKAVTPTSPSSPNIKANMAMGVLAGLIIAAAGAVIRELADNSVRTQSDIQAIITAPILSSVPKSPTLAGRTPAVIVKPRGHAAEEFRRLTTNLTFAASNKGSRHNVIVVTSAMPGEGKTTVAVNLAATFAERGDSVLLIDADVRHPSVAKGLGISNGVGLVQMLTKQVDAKIAVQQYWKPEFQVLPAEDDQAAAGVILSSNVMEDMIDQAAQHYDHVIVDTAPIQVSNDASVFARNGATVLLVISQMIGRKKALRDAARELKVARVKISGVAFNRVAHERSHKGNYYYYEESETKAKAALSKSADSSKSNVPRKARTASSDK
ncbi:polysaccharide biosynthesis tyrosine autokinase [Bifidobacterium callimiconis]|uniref:polysaccharide biosynthesis tyrosine autokinase n=1 Tax=Bifidobacterium callimiconis TaxID=2306973 RepID=UPI001BDD53D8|nr:polysaccharide biosynthesis tyrosine autokinase [Bifidobacterium callimiconis]MBT1177289.1 polysaccharide biosynthesis tyrosine autokinase [Bifidobacterium callimiconis]